MRFTDLLKLCPCKERDAPVLFPSIYFSYPINVGTACGSFSALLCISIGLFNTHPSLSGLRVQPFESGIKVDKALANTGRLRRAPATITDKF